MEIRPGKLVTIAPGQTTAISMSMTDGPRGFGGPWLLSEAGDYTAVIKIVLAVDGKQVELETDRVEFSVNAR